MSKYIEKNADRSIRIKKNIFSAHAVRKSVKVQMKMTNSCTTTIQAIAELKLHVLLYADIGMDPFTYFLTYARLAPVQAVTHGHPCTTGVPEIDYFVR